MFSTNSCLQPVLLITALTFHKHGSETIIESSFMLTYNSVKKIEKDYLYLVYIYIE